MTLLRFDPKKASYFIEVGWPNKGSAEKNGLDLRLVQKGADKKMKLVRELIKLSFEKDRLKQGIQHHVPELGELVIQYKKVLGFIPLVTITLNGEKLRGSEVRSSILGEISAIG